MTTKTKWIIFAISTLIVAVCSFLIYKFWIPIKSLFTQQNYYTQEEAQNLYDKGLADGTKNREELQSRIDYYVTLVDKIPTLEASIKQKDSTITSLEADIVELQADKNELLDKLELISSEHADCEETRLSLLNQISELSISIAEKEDTITSLEMDKILLQTQLAEYNSQIDKLQQDLDYYEQYLYGNVDSDKVVAKFMLDDSIYGIQVLNVNSIASIENPTSTEYITFNYWTTDGINKIELASYPLTENTIFIANIDRYYDVNFNVDGNITSQLVKSGSIATLPVAEPTKNGYVFTGWTLDGTTFVDVNTYKITANTTFIAKFTRLNLVEFVFDGKIIDTQSVKTGEYAEEINTNLSDKIIFNYWTVDGEKIDLSTYVITDYTQIVANITKLYDVTFKVDGASIYSERLSAGSTINIPTEPIKSGYRFVGWSVLGEIVDLSTYVLTEDVTFVAEFVQVSTITFKVDNTTFDSIVVDTGSTISYSKVPTKTNNVFLGWTLDGETIVDTSSINVTEDMTYIAKFRATSFTIDFSKSNAQLLQNTTNDGVGFYAYKYMTDLSEYSFDGQPFNITMNYLIKTSEYYGDMIKVNNINLNYSEVYGIHRYSYNYYPNSSDMNTHYDISIEVTSTYVRFAVYFYGDDSLRNYDFNLSLHMTEI